MWPDRVGWLLACVGFSGPMRRYFSLYRAISQREEVGWLVDCFEFNGPLRQYVFQSISGRLPKRGGVVRWCWVNFQCQGVLLIWIIVGQGLTALAVGAGGGCLDIFSLVYHFSLLSHLSGRRPDID